MEKLGTFLTITDYLVIAGSLILCTVVGIFYKGKKPPSGGDVDNVAEYFLGSRQMPILPIAVSMVATSLSAVPIVSGVGEMYSYGVEYAISPMITLQLGKVLAAFLIVPVFRYMEYVSIYQYLENRFDRSVRLGFASVYILQNLFQISVALYLPALLLATVTDFPFWITSTISGIMCTIYCVLGGFKAVIWTDVIQFIFMFSSLIIMIWIGTDAAGGPSVVLKEGFYEGFYKNIYWLDSGDKRFTVISSGIYGVFLGVQACSTSQAVAQRLLSVKDIKAAKKVVVITALVGSVFTSFIVGVAAVTYANFHGCDPMLRKKDSGLTSPDLMLLYFLQRFFADYPGFSGLVFAGILSSSLSTISSYINSFAAITLEDFIKPYFPLKNLPSERREILISKSLTAAFGTLAILLSFVVPHLGGVIKSFTSVMGALGGPLTALMCLGIFVPRVKKRACLVGIVVGISFCFWLMIGSRSVVHNYQRLPLSTNDCPDLVWNGNSTIPPFNATQFHPIDVTKLDATEIAAKPFPLYGLSFVWYGPIGFFITIIVAVLASFILKEKEYYIDVRLLSPIMAKYFTRSPIPEMGEQLQQNNVDSAVKRKLIAECTNKEEEC